MKATYLRLLYVSLGLAVASPALAADDPCANLPEFTEANQQAFKNCNEQANKNYDSAQMLKSEGEKFATQIPAQVGTTAARHDEQANGEELKPDGANVEKLKLQAADSYTRCQVPATGASKNFGDMAKKAEESAEAGAQDAKKVWDDLSSRAKKLAAECAKLAGQYSSSTVGNDISKMGAGLGTSGAKDGDKKEGDEKVGGGSGSGGLGGAMMPALLGAVGGGVVGYMVGKGKATTETATSTKTETVSNTNTATDTSTDISCTKLGLATNTDGTCMAATATSTTTSTTNPGNVVINGAAQDTAYNTNNSTSLTLPAPPSGASGNVSGAGSQTGGTGSLSNTATNSGTFVQNSLSGKSSGGLAALKATSSVGANPATSTDTATGNSSALAAPAGGGATWRRGSNDEEEALKAGAAPLNYNYIDGGSGNNNRSLAGENVQSTLNRIENPDCNSSDGIKRVACQNERKARDRAELAVYCSRYPGASKCKNLDQ